MVVNYQPIRLFIEQHLGSLLAQHLLIFCSSFAVHFGFEELAYVISTGSFATKDRSLSIKNEPIFFQIMSIKVAILDNRLVKDGPIFSLSTAFN